LKGDGTDHHRDGFGAPVGKFKNSNTPPELIKPAELKSMGIEAGKEVELKFESGLTVTGKLENILQKEGLNLLFTFTHCTVTFRRQTLFEPGWGRYDMAVGAAITSAYTGAADPAAFGYAFPVPGEKTHKIIHTDQAGKLHQLYMEVRSIRESGKNKTRLKDIWEELQTSYPREWLLPLEILELIAGEHDNGMAGEIRSYLIKKQQQDSNLVNLISNGLSLISN